MRRILKFLFRLIIFIGVLIGLAYITGNEQIPRGVRYTYLLGRSGPEVDDRNFFPYESIAATNPQPWPKGELYASANLKADQEQLLTDLHSVGFLVIHKDSLIFEKYWQGWDFDSVSNAFSVAKSYVSLLTGIAMQEGVINDVFQPVSDFLPEAKETCYSELRLHHLLTMSTGLDWSESGGNPFSDNAKGYYGTDAFGLSMDQPCRDEPGTEFDYISGSTQIMAEVLEQAYGRPLNELVEEKIWTPLGCEETAYWGKDTEDGNFKAFCCLYGTGRDFARIGQLYLDSGMWHGNRIIPYEFWKASITPAKVKDRKNNGAPNKRYGYYWWLAEVDGKPIYYCRGFHGQYVLVVPHEELIVVRMGMKREEVTEGKDPKDIFEWINIGKDLAGIGSSS